MSSYLAVGFDVPQNRPLIPPPFHQTVDTYKGQSVLSKPLPVCFAIDGRGHVVSSYEQPRPKRNCVAQLRSLQQHYTMVEDDYLILELLEEAPALYPLLLKAVKPLQHAFGAERIVYMRVLSSDEDSILKVAVQLPADFGADPERALRSFDEEWWLYHCHLSGGALVFDYEMQDAL